MLKELVKIESDGQIGNLVVYIPDNIQGKLPAFPFIPGRGEQNGIIASAYTWGPMGFIARGWKPNFIVACLQPMAELPSVQWTNAMLKYLVNNFPVDPTKLVPTGLSDGCRAILSYTVTSNMNYRPAALVGFSYAWPTENPEFKNLPMWGLCGDIDSGMWGWMATTWRQMIKDGWPNKLFTVMPGYGHYGWDDYYDPEAVANGKLTQTIYDWGLQMIGWNPSPQPQPVPVPARKAKTIITVYDNGDTDIKPAA